MNVNVNFIGKGPYTLSYLAALTTTYIDWIPIFGFIFPGLFAPFRKFLWKLGPPRNIFVELQNKGSFQQIEFPMYQSDTDVTFVQHKRTLNTVD